MTTLFSLESRNIWVVGAAGYLGQAIVKLLQQADASVLAIDIENRANDFIYTLQNREKLSAATLNTRDTDRSIAFVSEMIAQSGAPDGLIDLSYASTGKAFNELTAEDFDAVNHGGLTSTFILSREVGNVMKERKSGSIVLFSSMYGSVSPNPDVYESPMNVNPIEYGIGKAGIIQMTRYMAVQYGKYNVRCNCISPGPFPSPAVQQNNPEFVDRLANKVPMGRVGRQEEIAGAAAFLISDAASFITGQNLFVDGGWTSW
ncbi:SDR family oxidoreductase [Pedobacter heparinus]|uniref:SDR family oxidoreductase n=1 Tax=Pedobacter heparinus TaxID=984 RepID=UPI0029307B85|nr:SDR family oxidoreductase [Pedobacter heparinus]